VAGAVVLIGLVAFALYRRSQSAVPAEAPAAGDQAPEAAPAEGTAITAVVPIRLTPEASVAAERYRCVCGCNDPLSVCTCTETPGSRDMKTYLQSLVDEKRPMGEIDAAMVAKYGGLVLLSTPSPRPGRTPARP
jgi:cytochrome c-type biogenesis protein CcmH/NrfF